MKNFFQLKKLKQMDKSQWLIVALVGILLLVIAIPVDKKEGEESEKTQIETEEAKNESTKEKTTGISGNETYKAQLEQELAEMLESMEGVGKVKVMITLKDDGESVVEKDHSDTSNSEEETDKEGGTRSETQLQSEETTVYADEENSTPFISKELKPEVEGVLVLAEGGENTAVKQNISEAVLALFDLEPHKIVVVKMSGQEGAE